MMKDPKIKKAKIGDLIPDTLNFNKGTEFGGHLLEKSVDRFGAGRSILLDKHGRIIAGNKFTEKAGAAGLEDVLIVQTDGHTVVAVQRTDIDLYTPEGREMALADNATAKADLDWDEEALQKAVEEYDGFDPADWGVEAVLDPGDGSGDGDGDNGPAGKERKTFTFSPIQIEKIMECIDMMQARDPIGCDETFGNKDRDANALFLICMEWKTRK